MTDQNYKIACFNDSGELSEKEIVSTNTPSKGDVIFYNGTSWENLPAGSSGQYLQSKGTDDPEWTTISGTGLGDVSSSTTSTDNSIARFDGTTGKVIQDSSIKIDDSGNLTGVNTIDGYTFSSLEYSSFISLPYGTGADGDLYLTTRITLTRDMHYRNLTIGAGVSYQGYINTNGYRIYCTGTLDISECLVDDIIYCIGVNGSTDSGTYWGGAGGYGTPRGHRGGNGADVASSSTPGDSRGFAGESSNGWGGQGGKGGLDGLHDAANAGLAKPFPYGNIAELYNYDIGGGGGGGGRAASGSAAFAGAGGGEGAPGIFIACRNFKKASTNASPTIVSAGGTGGACTGSDAGSGGGGGGGAIVIICDTYEGASTVNFIESRGGYGRSNGYDSTGGYSGVCSITVMSTGTTVTHGPTANSGTVGGISYLTI